MSGTALSIGAGTAMPTGLREQLAAPFPPEWIDWKPQQAGWRGDPEKGGKPWVKLIAFIDNRAIMGRLDDVCGVDGWRNEFRELAGGGMLCGLSLKIGDDWVTKWDGAQATEIESVKGGLSSAMKRAAVQWGIGRYLYDVEITFGQIADDNDWDAKQVTPKDRNKKDMKPFRWKPPRMPAWALPSGSGKPGIVSEAQAARGEAAAKALSASPSGDHVMPGTRAHFGGFGGKRLKDVPLNNLREAEEQLRKVGSEKYTLDIDQIRTEIAAREQVTR